MKVDTPIKKDLIDKYTNSLSELLLEEISDEKKRFRKLN
jgi:hypothetical protein